MVNTTGSTRRTTFKSIPFLLYECRLPFAIGLCETVSLIPGCSSRIEDPCHKVGRIGRIERSGHVTPSGSAESDARTKQTSEMNELEHVGIENVQQELLTPSELGERASQS